MEKFCKKEEIIFQTEILKDVIDPMTVNQA